MTGRGVDGTTTDPVVTPRGFSVGSVDELHEAARRLDELGVEHGEVTPLPAFGLVVLSVQDPDDVNLELAAPHPDGRA